MMPFLFVWRISLYCFIMFAASSGFSTFSAGSFKSSISTELLMVMDSVSCFLISSLLRRFVFWLFSVSQKLKIKNNCYNINLKHPLQTKMQLHWAQRMFFSIWLRVVKVLRCQHFRKTFCQINLISKLY